MRLVSALKLSARGLSTLLFKSKRPLIGSIILTDKCNLSCRHCAVSNITSVIYPHAQITSEMNTLFREGVLILFFYGGEPFLWEDQGASLKTLVAEARKIGFLLVNVVTNGTLGLELPEADAVMVSLDGIRENHNTIRGNTYDTVLENIRNSSTDNIYIYMAINQINKGDIEAVCTIARDTPHVRAVSFNFHTPYPGTEYLQLSREEKHNCCSRIAQQMDEGYPVLNIKSALPYIADNVIRSPCRQCVIMENGQEWLCGRCIEIGGLCGNCGYFFAAEFSLLFSGNFNIIWDFLRTYSKYI